MKKIRDKKVGVSYYRRKFFVSRRRKTSWANPSVFEKVSIGGKIMDKKGVSRLSVEFFCPKSPENNVGEPFCVSEMFWYRKILR